MQEARLATIPPISAQTSASIDLDEVCRWLIDCQGRPVRLDADELPALGQSTQIRLALPMTALRAVLCALWLLDDFGAGGCLLAGQLRFVAHPTASGIRLSFSGHTAKAMPSSLPRSQADHATRQLLEVIAKLIARGTHSRASFTAWPALQPG